MLEKAESFTHRDTHTHTHTHILNNLSSCMKQLKGTLTIPSLTQKTTAEGKAEAERTPGVTSAGEGERCLLGNRDFKERSRVHS